MRRGSLKLSGWWRDVCELYNCSGGLEMKDELLRLVGKEEQNRFLGRLVGGGRSIEN